MKKAKKALSLLLSVALVCSLGACRQVKAEPVKLDKVYGGEILDIRTKYVKTYLEAKTEKEQIEALQDYHVSVGWDSSTPISVWWQGNGSESYTVRLSTDKQMKTAKSYMVECSEVNYTFENLIPATTYYYSISGTKADDSTQIDSFTVADNPTRWTTAGGDSNMRDLGGWNTVDGKKVKYGLIYRGGMLNGYKNGPTITERGRQVFVEQLNMRSEIDLRNDSDNGGQQGCAWVGGIYNRWSLSAYDSIIKHSGRYSEANLNALRNIFAFLSNESNYPVYIHCNWGADRTGTLAYLINGLLGVSYGDLIKDFELTSFSPSGARYRIAIENGKFSSTGIMRNDSGNYVAFGRMHNLFTKYYQEEGQTLASAIEKYLTEDVGVTQIQIDNIKKIMLT